MVENMLFCLMNNNSQLIIYVKTLSDSYRIKNSMAKCD